MDSLVIIVIIILLIVYYIPIEKYGTLALGPPPPIQGSVGDLVTVYMNVRGEFSKLPLGKVLEIIGGNENFVCSSTDNNIVNREALEEPRTVLGEIVPFANTILNKRGLKIASNPFDSSVILRPFTDKDEAYPTGFWLSVVDSDSVY